MWRRLRLSSLEDALVIVIALAWPAARLNLAVGQHTAIALSQYPGDSHLSNELQIDRYLPFLKSVLTPPRLQHSLAVMRVMAELSPIYLLDRLQAMTAGLLHDAARDLSHEEQLALAAEAEIELHDPCERHPVYLHALVGAYLVSKELRITDRLILDAIAAHSYAGNGHNFNTPLSLSLRFADILAPSQEWKGMTKLRSVVYARRIDEATLLHCRWVIEYFQGHRVPVHPNLTKQYQALLSKLAVTEAFFERW